MNWSHPVPELRNPEPDVVVMYSLWNSSATVTVVVQHILNKPFSINITVYRCNFFQF